MLRLFQNKFVQLSFCANNIPYQKIVSYELNSSTSRFKTLFHIVDSILHRLCLKYIPKFTNSTNRIDLPSEWHTNDSRDKFTYSALCSSLTEDFRLISQQNFTHAFDDVVFFLHILKSLFQISAPSLGVLIDVERFRVVPVRVDRTFLRSRHCNCLHFIGQLH